MLLLLGNYVFFRHTGIDTVNGHSGLGSGQLGAWTQDDWPLDNWTLGLLTLRLWTLGPRKFFPLLVTSFSF